MRKIEAKKIDFVNFLPLISLVMIFLIIPSNFLGILVSMSDYDLRWVHISPVNGHTTRLLVFITIQTLCIFRLPLVDLSSFHSHLFMYHFMLMAWNTSKKT